MKGREAAGRQAGITHGSIHIAAASPTCVEDASAPTAAASTSLLSSCMRSPAPTSTALAPTARAALARSALPLLLGGTAAAASGWVWVRLLLALGSDSTSPPCVAAALLMLVGSSRGTLLLASRRKPLRSCSTAPVGRGTRGEQGARPSDTRNGSRFLSTPGTQHTAHCTQPVRTRLSAHSSG